MVKRWRECHVQRYVSDLSARARYLPQLVQVQVLVATNIALALVHISTVLSCTPTPSVHAPAFAALTLIASSGGYDVEDDM